VDKKQRSSERAPTTTQRPLVCIECRREWCASRERWRMYVIFGDLPETLIYCPDCAAREFDR